MTVGTFCDTFHGSALQNTTRVTTVPLFPDDTQEDGSIRLLRASGRREERGGGPWVTSNDSRCKPDGHSPSVGMTHRASSIQYNRPEHLTAPNLLVFPQGSPRSKQRLSTSGECLSYNRDSCVKTTNKQDTASLRSFQTDMSSALRPSGRETRQGSTVNWPALVPANRRWRSNLV